jgi:hypothetical protein
MDNWTPTQRSLARTLLGVGEDLKVVEARPTFDPGIRNELTDTIEEALRPVAERYTKERPLWINKRKLNSVMKCEGLHLAELNGTYVPSPATLRGRVAHEATLLLAESPALSPTEAIDHSLAKFASKTGEDAAYLNQAPLAELAQLRALARGDAVSFLANFPILPTAWWSFEYPVKKTLCEGRVVVSARYDFVMGRPDGRAARRLIVDMKTGSPWPMEHRADLLLYALLETLVSGVPPFRVASFYTEAADIDQDDITVEKLQVAARRLSDGVIAIAEVEHDLRPPILRGNGACNYCPVSEECIEGISFLETRHQESG